MFVACRETAGEYVGSGEREEKDTHAEFPELHQSTAAPQLKLNLRNRLLSLETLLLSGCRWEEDIASDVAKCDLKL